MIRNIKHLLLLTVELTVGVSVAQATFSRSLPASPSAADFASTDFDFIVVGGGTAGLAVAARLAEATFKVGVIEAGEYRPNDPIIDIPHNFGKALGNATYDWQFTSTPQPNLDNRTVVQNRGKVLGGSSAINFEVLTRGAATEYSAWSALNFGSEDWTWKGLLPFFIKSETFTPPGPGDLSLDTSNSSVPRAVQVADQSGAVSQFLEAAAEHLRGTNVSVASLEQAAAINSSTLRTPDDHGFTGPIDASYSGLFSKTFGLYVESIDNLGINNNPDAYDGFNVGIFDYPHSVNPHNETRSYAASGYFAPNINNPNLVVLTGAQATKIDFDSAADKNGLQLATGVTFVANGTSYTAKASKEVILSAGAFQSPQLLELSGIGNSTLLGSFGIDTLVDLPGVGENLQDHPLVPTTYMVKPGVMTWDELNFNATFAAIAAEEYAKFKTGILTSTSTVLTYVPLQSFLSASNITNLIDSLAQELLNEASSLSLLQWAEYVIQLLWLSNPSVPQVEILFDPLFTPTPNDATAAANTSYLTIYPTNQHTISRGSVHITTTDPLVQPAINPNYQASNYDKSFILAAMKFIRKLVSTPPLSNVIQAFNDPPAVATDEELAEYIEQALGTEFHSSGTAALAPRALNGVVDTNLLVYGTNNLRVADASIIPILVSAHLQAPIYAIGEKAADIIKNVWT